MRPPIRVQPRALARVLTPVVFFEKLFDAVEAEAVGSGCGPLAGAFVLVLEKLWAPCECLRLRGRPRPPPCPQYFVNRHNRLNKKQSHKRSFTYVYDWICALMC